MPIQDYVHVRFCGFFTALDDDKAFAIRGEGIVGTGGAHSRFAPGRARAISSSCAIFSGEALASIKRNRNVLFFAFRFLPERF